MPSTPSTSTRRAQMSDVTTTVPANIRLDEDVLKTSWRRLSSSSSKEVFKTSWRRLDEDKYILVNLRLRKTSSRCLQNILVKTNIFVLSILLQDVLQKRLQDVFKTFCQDVFKTSRKYVLKTSSRCFEDVSSS